LDVEHIALPLPQIDFKASLTGAPARSPIATSFLGRLLPIVILSVLGALASDAEGGKTAVTARW
jgi:hypothetical protein